MALRAALTHKSRQLGFEGRGMGEIFWCFFQMEDQIAHLSNTSKLKHLFVTPRGVAVHFGMEFKQLQMLTGCELRTEKLLGFPSSPPGTCAVKKKARHIIWVRPQLQCCCPGPCCSALLCLQGPGPPVAASPGGVEVPKEEFSSRQSARSSSGSPCMI